MWASDRSHVFSFSHPDAAVFGHEKEWLPVVHFDHDAEGPRYRNVELVGLHLDLYHPHSGQIAKVTNWQPQPANEAMADAEDYIRMEADRLIRRLAAWL